MMNYFKDSFASDKMGSTWIIISKNYYLMSTLKLEESPSTLEICPSTLEIFPSTTTLENEIQKLLDLEMPSKSEVAYLNYNLTYAVWVYKQW